MDNPQIKEIPNEKDKRIKGYSTYLFEKMDDKDLPTRESLYYQTSHTFGTGRGVFIFHRSACDATSACVCLCECANR